MVGGVAERLYVVCGPPASGKTEYGRALARRERAVFLDSDVAVEPVVEAGLQAAGMSPDDRDSPAYKRIFREPVYEAIYRLAAENLAHLPVVIAAPFTRESQDPAWPARLEERFGVPVEVHFVHCHPDERRKRIEGRGAPRDKAKLAEWIEYLQTTAEARPPFPHVWVDTSPPGRSGSSV